MAKSNQHTVAQRVRKAAELLLKGYSREDIVQYSAKNWRVCDRQGDKYIQKANRFIEDSITKKIELDYAKAVRRFEHLYKKAIEKDDLRTAVNVNKELATLQGLYKQQIEQTGTFQFISNIPD